MKNKIKPTLLSLLSISIVGLLIYYWSLPEQNEFSKYRPNVEVEEEGKDVTISNKGEKTRKPANREKQIVRPKLVGQSPFLKRQERNIQKNPKFVSELIINSEQSFNNGDYDFSLVENLFAIREKDYNGTDEIVERKLNYVIVKSDSIPNLSTPVVQNLKNGSFAIFTGVLKVKLFDYAELVNINISAAYVITDEYKYLDRVFFKFDDYQETISSYEELKVNGLVELVEIELLEYVRTNR